MSARVEPNAVIREIVGRGHACELFAVDGGILVHYGAGDHYAAQEVRDGIAEALRKTHDIGEVVSAGEVGIYIVRALSLQAVSRG